MKAFMKAVAVLGTLVTVGSSAFAAEADRREGYQQERLEQGMRSGELTGPEAVRLERREAQVNREIARDRACSKHGRMTRRERLKVNREQNRLSRSIHREKHDGQFR